MKKRQLQQYRRQEHNQTLPNASGATKRNPFGLDYDELFKTQTIPKAPKISSGNRRRKLKGSTRALGTFVEDLFPGVINMIPGAKVGIGGLHAITSKFLTTGL